MAPRSALRLALALASFFSILLAPRPARCDAGDDAYAAFLNGNYSLAFSLAQPEAQAGNALAEFTLGRIYAEGAGRPIDGAQATKYFAQVMRQVRPAAIRGDALSLFILGRMFDAGWIMTKNHAQALNCYQRAAKQGNAQAEYALGVAFGVPGTYGKALPYLGLAAKQGHAEAQQTLGLMYYRGQGVVKNDAEALRWFRSAAESGNAEAQFDLGWMYDKGQQVPKDDAQAAGWYRKAAEMGNVEAQNALAAMSEEGRSVPKDEGVKWARLAAQRYMSLAEQGNPQAQFGLAAAYEHGRGLDRDFDKAADWYRKAAAGGDARAQPSLDLLYSQGRLKRAAETAQAGALELPVPDGFRIVPDPTNRRAAAIVLEDARNPAAPRRVAVVPNADATGNLDTYVAGLAAASNALGFLTKCSASPAEAQTLANGWSGKRYEFSCQGKIRQILLIVQAGERNYAFVAGNVSPAELAAIAGAARTVEIDLTKELGPPPTGEVLVSGLAPEEALRTELAPLPYRSKSGSAGLLIYLAVAAAALAYRLLVDKPKPPDPYLDPGSPYPVQIDQRGFFFSVITVTDAAGRSYRCEFVRVQRAAFVAMGLIVGVNLVLKELLLRHVLGSGSAVPMLGLLPLIVVCAVVVRAYPKKLKVLDAGGALLLQANQRWLAFFPNVYDIRDGRGALAATAERIVPAFPRKHWRLKDASGKILLRIREDSLANSLARKMLGHLWGLLRTDFLVYSGERTVGMIKRSRSLRSNIFPSSRLFLRAPEGIDPLLIMAAALCVEIADTDLWHPWYG